MAGDGGLWVLAVLWLATGDGGHGMGHPCPDCYLFNILHRKDTPPEHENKTCRYPCQCPVKTLDCAGGVSIVKDGCGCCFMCARQHGDLCSVKDKCDKKKGLYCDHDGATGGNGVCRAYASKPCKVNGVTYQDGEKFKPECSRLCTCQNGNYGCVNLCPQEFRRPSLAHCQRPRLMNVSTECCRQWTCEVKQKLDSGKSPRHALLKAEKVQGQKQSYQSKIARYAPYQNTQPDCVKNSSDWTHCSATCGVGISTRYYTKNCQQVDERRLCYLRPCGVKVTSKSQAKCTPTTRLVQKERLQYQDCHTVKRHRFKLCTTCKTNRCCYPRRSRTRRIQFECSGGVRQTFQFMWIKSCRCDRVCHQEDHDDKVWTV